MSTQNEAAFLKDCLQYNTIPIVKTFFVDTLTPIQLIQVLKDEAVYLLESNDEQSRWSNYSFIGLSPFMTIEEENQQLLVKDKLNKELYSATGVTEAIQYVKKALKIKELDIDLPFRGGAVGYIGYDAITSVEHVPKHKNNDLNLKTHHLLFCETILVFSHSRKELTFIHYLQLNELESIDQRKESYRKAIGNIDRYYNQICNYHYQYEQLTNPRDFKIEFSKFASTYSKDTFIEHVNKIKEYISAGDVFQTVLSQRFELPIQTTGFELYRVLRVVNPSPYLFYINLKECEIVGSSPERLIQVHDGHLEIHPIAGTRRRGNSPKEDEQLGEELLKDKKEEAEHYMLLDLARNDIGRVAEYGSVKVPVQKELHYFSHVMHLVSKVTGRLQKEVATVDALLASFPAGTVSGAPKVRAMQIIQELEPVARNIYAGTIAYIGFDGNIDSCIAIRTAVIKEEKAYVQAGAGIVADSIPELEYKETLNKASGVIKSILIAEQMFSREEKVQC
ncbi:anthranilate synthase component I [Bacillus suaedaesalsae]|uniref:Anthranilate synthase component 1 n=1 Tax=Bacillus suaedaesalsae TaxID=2810349 RepID=A0ABS2DNV9_9BACI|nr:anthranilate synthase component I [Bacillus suaedaesalsae]MBM6619860.1 anthranilate synthase component I [Bacillus suaedaesalsae]